MRSPERKVFIGPSARVLTAMTGKLDNPRVVNTFDDKGNLVGQEKVRFIEDRFAMIGFSDIEENKKRAGIFNHYMLVMSAAVKLGELLSLNGHAGMDVQLIGDGSFLSHAGRWLWDEARFHLDSAPNAQRKKEMGDTRIAMEQLTVQGFPQALIDVIAVHGLPQGTYPYEKVDTWNKKLPFFLDFRIDQTAMPLTERIATMQRAVERGSVTQKAQDRVNAWARGVEKELFDALQIVSYDEIVKNPANLKARIKVAIKLGKFSVDEAEKLRKTRVFLPKSGDDVDPAEFVEMTQDEFLEKLQLYPEDINDTLLKPERWERYIRRLYINDAEKEAFEHISEFPEGNWWTGYVRELYERNNGVVYDPDNVLRPNQKGKNVRTIAKPRGIQRVIEFYQARESVDFPKAS